MRFETKRTHLLVCNWSEFNDPKKARQEAEKRGAKPYYGKYGQVLGYTFDSRAELDSFRVLLQELDKVGE